MTRIIENMRTGRWLQRDRLIVYPLVMLAITAAATGYVLISNGGMLPNGSPFGSDFVSFWTAARLATEGHAAIAYDPAQFAAAQDALFGDGNFYAFFYPPHYLAYLLPLGALGYAAALAAWMVTSFAAAAAVVWIISGRRWEALLLTAAFPATFLTLAHGQNAFLSAALFGGGLLLLPKRPILAGVLIGLLTFKPQLGLLLPLALIAGSQWRAIISATATTALLVAGSILLFGAEVWADFIAQGGLATDTLRDGLVGWNKMISVYAMLRLSGLAHAVALAIQLAVSIGVAAATAWVWRQGSGFDRETRNAVLLIGALVATPFGLNYDIFLLAPAIAFIAARGMHSGFAPHEKTLLACAYLSPFAMLWLMADGIVFAPVLLMMLFTQQLLIGVGQSQASAGRIVPAQ